MFNVTRGNVITVVSVLLALFAIAAVASTITDVSTIGEGSGKVQVDFGDTQGQNNADGEAGRPGVENGELSAEEGANLQVCIEPLAGPAGILGVIGIVTLALGAIYLRFNFATTVFSSFAIVPVVVGAWAFLTNCISGSARTTLSGSSIMSNSAEGVVTSSPVPPWMLATGFGVIVVGALVVVFTMTMSGEEKTFEPAEEVAPEEAEEEDFARAAGRAADRIEQANVAVDNAVYQAWLEMTTLLDLPNPDTLAPMDFAESAIEFGLDEDDVYELTELFNEVRYGNASADEREERAVETLRHIESAYETTVSGDAGGGADTDADGGESR